MSLKNSVLRELSREGKTAKQLKAAMGVDAKKLKKALGELVESGQVRRKKGVFILSGPRPDTVKARLVKLGRSFGFAVPEDGKGDIFIPGHSLAGALPGDELEVAISAHPRIEQSREGEVVAVTAPHNQLVGTVDKANGRLVLRPDNARDTALPIRRSADGGVKPGEKAAGVVIQRGHRHDEHRVGITVRFGSADSARQCTKAILYAAGVEKSFPSAVKAEAKQVAGRKITKDDLRAREDLRDELIFTIDGADTRDIDDAISLSRSADGGYLLGVHIADVSHYVTPGSELDGEAIKRGTSIYYGDSVVHMLPRPLSTGVCSLNPGEDRLAFSCRMSLDSEGRLLDYRFFKSVLRSRVQAVYSEVNILLADMADPALKEKYAEVSDSLLLLRELYGKLVHLREARGSMEIEDEEAKLILNEDGVCVDVQKRQRGTAERIIEECMILANQSAAHLARRQEIPFVYRVHDKPSADKMDALKALLKAVGIDFRFEGDTPTQQELARLLDETRGTNLERPVHQGVLRSMAKAKYEPDPKGHYGLSLKDYTHFTSPIRRYPDLAIHRILGDLVSGTPAAELQKRYKRFVAEASVQSSERELAALQVERNCDAAYKAEYMQQFIGEVFEGVISSVTRFGVYVQLDNTVEGLVPMAQLSSGPLELVEGVCLRDAQAGKTYSLGDAMRVQVAGVDISQGNVDFAPAQ